MSLPQPSDSFAWTQEPWGAALQCVPLVAAAPHLFTSAAVSISRDPADPALASVAFSMGLTPDAIVQVHQVHGRDVVVLRNGDSHGCATEKMVTVTISADALVADDPRRALGVRVADCVPILMADKTGAVVAAVHAGWRGTAAGVAASAIKALHDEFGVDPRDVIAALGPAIRACCYEVGPELKEAFERAGHNRGAIDAWFSPGRGDRLFLDVPRANRDQLESLGVPAGQIFESGLCTAHHEVFHSYRRQGTEAGRGLAVIRTKQDSGVSVRTRGGFRA